MHYSSKLYHFVQAEHVLKRVFDIFSSPCADEDSDVIEDDDYEDTFPNDKSRADATVTDDSVSVSAVQAEEQSEKDERGSVAEVEYRDSTADDESASPASESTTVTTAILPSQQQQEGMHGGMEGNTVEEKEVSSSGGRVESEDVGSTEEQRDENGRKEDQCIKQSPASQQESETSNTLMGPRDNPSSTLKDAPQHTPDREQTLDDSSPEIGISCLWQLVVREIECCNIRMHSKSVWSIKWFYKI